MRTHEHNDENHMDLFVNEHVAWFDCSICGVFRLFVCGCVAHVCDASTFQMFVFNVPHMFASV